MLHGNSPKKLRASGLFKRNHCPSLSIELKYSNKTLLLFHRYLRVLVSTSEHRLRYERPACRTMAEPSQVPNAAASPIIKTFEIRCSRKRKTKTRTNSVTNRGLSEMGGDIRPEHLHARISSIRPIHFSSGG
jgi:hypothetical protein